MTVAPRLFLVVLALLLSIALLTPHASMAAFTQVYQAMGNLHLEVTGAAGLGLPATGTLTLANAPQGTIKQAYLYATQTNNTVSLTGTFAGAPLPITGPHASEALLITLSTYRWDVTANVVPGVSSYAVTVTDGLGQPIAVAGVGLAVVWEDATTQPMRTVTIVDGVKQVGEGGSETESMTFTTLPAGSTTVWVFTTDDDASLGETVSYNSSNIGGPLVGNLGLNASVLKMRGLSGLGSSTLSIFTSTDHLTWVLGATAVDQGTVPTPESTWGRIKSLFR
jgi:hypothetical protein